MDLDQLFIRSEMGDYKFENGDSENEIVVYVLRKLINGVEMKENG